MRFHKLEEQMRRAGAHSADSRFADRLRDSQKFYIGDVGSLPEVPVSVDSFPKLPFNLCAFEAQWVMYGLSRQKMGNPMTPDTVICIAQEFDNGDIEVRAWDRAVIRGYDPHQGTFGGYQEHWFSTGEFLARKGGGMSFGWGDEPRVQQNCGRLVVTEDDDEYLARLAAYWIGTFLNVLNCVNVKTHTVDAPASLNKKRAKSGKPPIYSYKTLVLKPSVAQRANQGGTHETPRIHLRRGHIKHRRTGDYWWQPHLVGDKERGVVMKDYRADELVH